MLIDFILTFVLGLLIGITVQKCRVIYVREDEFELDDPNLPEDIKELLEQRRRLDD